MGLTRRPACYIPRDTQLCTYRVKVRSEFLVSIADRVFESIKKYELGDLENALIQLCIAVDATSKREFPGTKKVGDRFRAFVRSNLDIVTFSMFGDCVPMFKVGEHSMEAFIYKVLRCGLLHEGELSERFKFVEIGELIAIGANKWRVPKTFLFGLTLAVVGARSNFRESLPVDFKVWWCHKQFNFSELWGQSQLIREAMVPTDYFYMINLNAIELPASGGDPT